MYNLCINVIPLVSYYIDSMGNSMHVIVQETAEL